jgi:hypothetical protein
MQNSLFTVFFSNTSACRPYPITKVINIIQILNFAHETFISSSEKSEEVWIGPTGQDEVYAPVSHL